MTPRAYTALLLFISGMGGFLYGYDIGIIGAALLYLNKTVALTVAQESFVVAAVLAGGTVSSLAAGALADFIGRKRLMVAAAVMGLGLAQVPDYMAGQELEGGLLVEVMSPYRPAPMPISAVTPSSRLMPPRVKLVLEALEVLRKRSA